MNDIILNTMQVIGTVACSISGALAAIGCGLDLFGVVFLGCVTAVGGGILRDILMGRYPPAIFSNVYILLIAGLTSIIVFIIAYINNKKFSLICEKIEPVNNIFDAIGLSAFTVMGTEAVCASGFSGQACFTVIMGMLTGVGGGIFRDVLISKPPYVLTKHIYALASLFGSAVYYIIRLYVNSTVLASVVCILSVITIRMLASRYEWQLPKVRI